MNAYPLENLARRGHYVQAITGPDPKWPVGRELVQGHTVKSRGIREYGAKHLGAPAWILRASDGHPCRECGHSAPLVELIAATEIGWLVVGSGYTSTDMLTVWESGPPGPDPTSQVADALETTRVAVYAAELETPF